MTSRIDDEIVEEIRRRRQAHAESLGFDLKRITLDLQRQERDSGAPVVMRSPRKPTLNPTAPAVCPCERPATRRERGFFPGFQGTTSRPRRRKPGTAPETACLVGPKRRTRSRVWTSIAPESGSTSHTSATPARR